jgi:hypothetical protein
MATLKHDEVSQRVRCPENRSLFHPGEITLTKRGAATASRARTLKLTTSRDQGRAHASKWQPPGCEEVPAGED